MPREKKVEKIIEFARKKFLVLKLPSDPSHMVFLKNKNDLDNDWIEYCKQEEGIKELTDEHCKVINALQDYHNKNGINPMTRILSKITGFPLKRIWDLFPTGGLITACKMAGLPKPSG